MLEYLRLLISLASYSSRIGLFERGKLADKEMKRNVERSLKERQRN
ncbi:MAG: hypothetical protein J6I74_01860 [Schwartzia sp.]|nr:hypothetical protein [Schwartzia sp. (in: firmicutes)]